MADRKSIDAAREALTGYLDGLKVAGTGKSRDYTQLTFRDSAVSPAIPRFQDWEIVSVRTTGKAAKKATVKLLLCSTGSFGLRWQKGTLNLICETAPYEPSEDGEWGVCPASWRPEGKPERMT